MSQDHSIPAFPADVSRDDFGHWLSGFVDGEGCFRLRLARHNSNNPRPTPVIEFVIKMRADELPILRTIQSYFGCGRMYGQVRDGDTPNANPTQAYKVITAATAHYFVVPHFDRYPLRAKKAGAFPIWRRGVELVHIATSRPRLFARTGKGCFLSVYTEAEIAEFTALCAALKAQRLFVMPQGAVFPKDRPRQGFLFD